MQVGACSVLQLSATHGCPLEQHHVCPMTLGKHNPQPWLPHLVAYKELVFAIKKKQNKTKTKTAPVDEVDKLKIGTLIYKNRLGTNNSVLVHPVKLDQE